MGKYHSRPNSFQAKRAESARNARAKLAEKKLAQAPPAAADTANDTATPAVSDPYSRLLGKLRADIAKRTRRSGEGESDV